METTGPVVEIVTAFSPTFVPLPADQDFTGNGLITQSFEKNNGPVEYAVHLNVRGAYDDNIALTRTNRLDDKYIQIQPSLMLGIVAGTQQRRLVAPLLARDEAGRNVKTLLERDLVFG